MQKISFIQAAYNILKEKEVPLSAEQITKLALNKELIDTSGKTPIATMGARIYMDIKKNADKSLFIKTERGKFGLREWHEIKEKRMPFRAGSFKSSAYQVLKLENKPLSIQTITTNAQKRNLFTSTGKTPEATMGAQLYMDIKKLGNRSVFVQLGKNKFGLRSGASKCLKMR